MLELFGDKLRWLRIQRGKTQSELAHQLKLATQSHISHLEAGHSSPSLDLVMRAADFFEVSTEYLLRDMLPIEPPIFVKVSFPLEHSLPQQFGTNLRQLRKQRGITQIDLATSLGTISQAAVSAFELGEKTPSIDFVLSCADLFGVPTDALLRPNHSVA